MLEDTDISGDIGMLLADARDRLESTAFAVGTGSTQPKGIVTALQAVTASRVAGSSGAAGAADFVLADVYALANALPPRYRPNSSWMAEQSILNRTRRFGEGSTANAAFWADLGVAIPPLLLGRPVYQSSEMDSTIVSGSNDDILILGDFRQYYIVDRIGMQLMYEPLVKGANRRPTGEVGWVAFWRVGGDTVNADAFRMLRV
jgi:HK97 family phage major capsid protein